MRVKDSAARQIEAIPFEQVAGTSSKKGEVVEFQSSVFCSGSAMDRFLDGITEATRRRLLEHINDRFENDVTPVLVARDGKRQLIAFKVPKSDGGHHRPVLALADLNEIPIPRAARLGIKTSTARTQLASIFAKTQTRRQARLVALLGRVAQLAA